MDTILTCAQMRAADKYTIEELGVPSLTLMEQAGEAIADRAERALGLRGGKRVLAVCGGGNNGGDGFVAARLLAERGYTAEAYVLPGKNSPDCAAVRAKFKGKVHAALPQEKYDVVIDALFGTGFHGEPQGEAAAAIGWIEQSGAFVISADIPSGLDGDTGEAGLCVRACETVTIGEYKAGLLLGDGPDVCGEIVRADIGISLPADGYAVRFSAAELSHTFPPKRKNSHKGSYGRATILGGCLEMAGAALLSSRAALAAGAGYTRLACPRSLFPHCIGKYPELLLCPQPDALGRLAFDAEALARVCELSDCIAVGMGAGVSEELYKIVCCLSEHFRGPLVIDADALNALARYGTAPLRGRANVVLTPHLKEFSRLAGCSVEEVRAGGMQIARQFAADLGVTLLLKSNTSIVTDGKRTALNTEGCPALARGGSGDVLAGILCAILARGVAPFEGAAAAAHLLGRAGVLAAEKSNEYSPLASDVIAHIPQAITQLMRGQA